jgi:hypothetical protein
MVWLSLGRLAVLDPHGDRVCGVEMDVSLRVGHFDARLAAEAINPESDLGSPPSRRLLARYLILCSNKRINPLMKCSSGFRAPKPTPMAIAPPREASYRREFCKSRQVQSRRGQFFEL